MILSEKLYDVVVIGAGHAGCEAALACARMGVKTLLLTMNPDSLAQMSCNPAIGGIAKGHIVREIDALGGEMAKVTDRTGIQFRMLNKSKGPAVWAPRAQCDKKMYHIAMKEVIEKQDNLNMVQAEAVEIIADGGKVTGVLTNIQMLYQAKSVIVTTGTFLNGIIHIGETTLSGGRAGERSSKGISPCLERLGFDVQRLKTGTPPRLNAGSIDFSRLEIQEGDNPPIPFSYQTKSITQNQLACYITYTNSETHKIIKDNFHRAPLFSGKIKGRGPRYCPSIEDKIHRFSDKERHHLFLEPEGYHTNELYINGLSTSFPQDIQEKIVRSIHGLENAEIIRYGYAIEYDYCPPTQLKPTLETKRVQNLYFAGQINGTSGYEEAACQGLMAGINSVLKLRSESPFILLRSEAYIGVLIDDLVTNGTEEPYRMFTSRAEHRLLLRQENADERLMKYGYNYGLISDHIFNKYNKKRLMMERLTASIKEKKYLAGSLEQYIRRPEARISEVSLDLLGELEFDEDVMQRVEISIKYQGYIDREKSIVDRMKQYEDKKIPEGIDYSSITALSLEAKDKLCKIRPVNLAQASRISGVTPCDISVLSIFIEKNKRQSY